MRLLRLARFALATSFVAAASCSSNVETVASGTGAGGGATTGATTTGSTTTTAGTGGAPAAECVTDADCALELDCCACTALSASAPPPICDAPPCVETVCSSLGVTKATCEYGSCIVADVYHCDPFDVLCNGVPPDCAPGFQPEVAGQCWTGACVPAWLCDVVVDCADCGVDQMCVESFNDVTGNWKSCRGVPAACGAGPATCACAGFVCTDGGFTACTDIAGGISCGF